MHWVQRVERYREAGPHLLLHAHLPRIADRQRRQTDRARIRAGSRTPSADRVAPGGNGASWSGARYGAVSRSEPVAHGLKQTRAYLEPVRGAGGPPDRVRPHAVTDLGGEGLSPSTLCPGNCLPTYLTVDKNR